MRAAREGTARTRRRGGAAPALLRAAALLLLALAYGLLAAELARFGAFWSPDSGARFVMLRSGLEQGRPVYLAYPHAAADPEGRLHPLDGYALRLPRGFCTTYPPLFPLLAAPGYRWLGFGGLALAPLLAGVGAVAVTHALARRIGLRTADHLAACLALATPLPLYAVVFWDTTLHMLVVAGAGLCLFRAMETVAGAGDRPCDERRARGFGALAGALLGLGLFLHELLGAFCAAVLLSGLPMLARRNERGVWVAVATGFAAAALLWAGANQAIYGIPTGPHTLGPNHLLHPQALARMLDPRDFVERALLQLVGAGDSGPLPGGEGVLALLLALFAAAAASAGRAGAESAFGHAALPLAVLAGAVAALQLPPEGWASGLFLATPLLVPALVPPPGGTDDAAGRFARWIWRACLLFGLMVLLNPLVPGMDWGSRYLLPALPLLALLAARALERAPVEWARPAEGSPQAASAARLAVRRCAAFLAAVSLVSQALGLRAIRRDLAFSRSRIDRVRRLDAPLVVSDIWWLGAELAAAQLEPRLLHVEDREEDRRALVAVLEGFPTGAGPAEVVYFGTPQGAAPLRAAAARARPPFQPIGERIEEGWLVARFRRVGPRARLP